MSSVYRDHNIARPDSSRFNFFKLASFCRASTMVLLQWFASAILLLGVTSGKAYSPYENIQLGFSNTPNLIYTSSEFSPAFSGYSYTTQDRNGGGSNVIFTTGADSVNRIRNGMDSTKMPEKDTPNKSQENVISSNEQSEVVEASMNKQEDYNLNDAVTIEAKNLSTTSEAENNLVEHQQASPQPLSFVHVSPYPAFKANLLPLTYHVPSHLQTQFYSSNSHPELPLSNIGFYNPAVPLLYQVSDNSFKHASTAAEDVKVSTKSHITKNSQTDVTTSKSGSIHSNVIESRSQFEPNTVEETSGKSVASASKFESMITSEKVKQKTARSGRVNYAEKSESSDEQIAQSKASSIELSTTETSPSTSTSSIKKCKCD